MSTPDVSVNIRRMFAPEAAIGAMKFRFSAANCPQMRVQCPLVLVPLGTLWANVVPRLDSIHRSPFLDPERGIHEATSGQMPLQMALRGVWTVAEVASIFLDVEIENQCCNTQVVIEYRYSFVIYFPLFGDNSNRKISFRSFLFFLMN